MITVQETPAWKEAAESSKQPRYPWRKYLGMPLRQFAYEKASEGWEQEQTSAEVKFRVWSKMGAPTPSPSGGIEGLL